MRYDAAIIGAGADGLCAAAHLARAGLSVVVIEREAQAGGRLQTRQFRPGFFASPYLDNVPEIPGRLLEGLEIALRPVGPAPDAVRQTLFQAQANAFRQASSPERRPLLSRWLTPEAHSVSGPTPTVPRIEPVAGGLGSLGSAFCAAALAAGAKLRLGLAAADVLLEKNLFGRTRVGGVLLADGGRIEASAVISTLDLYQSMFSWRLMPPALVEDARALPIAGGTARLLLALGRPVGDSVLMVAGDADARTAWQQGLLPAQPPLTFDPVSARDAALAPPGAAVATVTLDCVPCRLAQGPWTHSRRVDLAARTLARLAPQLPNLLGALLAVEIIVPPDIEAALGVTEGDLEGGGPAAKGVGPRTTLPRFYLGGSSTPAGRLGTGAAGLAAALSVLADR